MRLIKTLSCLLLAPALAGAQDAPSEGAPLPRVEIVTNLGSFVLELDRERAPFTVGNFLDYAREGHYSGTIFHRVIHSFVAQAGGYTANMVAKPTCAARSVWREPASRTPATPSSTSTSPTIRI
jgi:hypothetical protein